MAQGFATIQRNAVKNDTGYTTLFEKITEMTGGENKVTTGTRMLSRKQQVTIKKTQQKLSDKKELIIEGKKKN